MQRVAVLGASNKPDRYSYQAVEMLADHGHQVFPISRDGAATLGHPGYTRLEDIDEDVDVVTIYVNPDRLAPLLDAILVKRPRQVIFNPGTESEPDEHKLQAAGITTRRACTLVLLSTGQFEPVELA